MKIVSNCPLCEDKSLHVLEEDGIGTQQCINCGYVSSDKYIGTKDNNKYYKDLPENDPIKISGKELFPKDFKDYKQRNLFTRYLKSALGANDPYIYYFLWEEGNWDIRDSQRKKTEESKYFPNVVKWVENLVQQNIISHIGRVIFFHCEHDGKAFEHRDMYAIPGETQDYKDNPNEFIHVRNNTKRGFYLWDPEKRSKTYL